MKLDMKISLCCGNLNMVCMFSILAKYTLAQTTYEHKKKTQIGLHIHQTMHNYQYKSFLGFAKPKNKMDHVIMIIIYTNNIKIEKPIMLHRCKMAV
jgi:hypothetical protein